MSDLQPAALKVVELRAELGKRNLPTKGKKDELIQRLTEAIEQQKEEDEQLIEKPEEQLIEKPEEQLIENPEEPVIEKPEEQVIATETQIVESEENKTVQAEGASPVSEQVDTLTETEVTETVTEVPAETVVSETPQESTEKKTETTVQETDKGLVEVTVETVVETKKEEQLIKKPEVEQLIKKPEEQLIEKPEEQLIEKPEEQLIVKEQEQLVEKNNEQLIETPDEQVIIKENEQLIQKTDEQLIVRPEEQLIQTSEEQQVIKKSEEQVIQVQHPPAEDMETDASNKRKRSVEGDDLQEDKRAKVEDNNADQKALFAKGFVRPLIIRHVQDLFANFGPVKRFWMDAIKTHCYVIYETQAEAKEALEGISGLKFPADTGRILDGGLLTSVQAEELIEHEQNAANQRLKVDWEAAIENIKSGGSLSSNNQQAEKQRKLRSIGIGQIAKQLAQANNEPSLPSAQKITPERKEVSLDDLFRKTKTLPALYYLPNTDQEAKLKLEKLQ